MGRGSCLWGVFELGKKRTEFLARVGRHPLLMILLAVLLAGGVFYAAVLLDKQDQQPETRGTYTGAYHEEAEIITVNEKAYRKKDGLTTILLMGVDKPSDSESIGFQNGGQADFLRLLVIDDHEKKVRQIAIDRDSMTDVTILSFMGKERGTRVLQVCLAHGFGDGKELSCQMEVRAVSRLLLGTDIDYYMALNLDGISVLNDFVGGVEVTLKDDFSIYDPEMTAGTTLTLRGIQAQYYTRSRYYINDGTNEYRMERQQDYIQKLSDKLYPILRKDRNYVISLYDELEPYLVTDLKKGRLVNLTWGSRNYPLTIDTLPGEHIEGEGGFIEYWVDEGQVQDLILSIFYEPV